MNDFDLGWAVGLFDGEGCITISTATKRHKGMIYKYSYPNLILTNTDLSLVLRFQNLVGGRYCGTNRHENDVDFFGNKPLYQWAVFNKEAHRVMEMLYPHLSERRQHRWGEVVALCSSGKEVQPIWR